MSKRKRKKQRPARRKTGPARRPSAELQSSIRRAVELVEQGRPEEAVELLEPLLDAYPREAELHYFYGFAWIQAGDPWAGLEGYERAVQLRRDPEYWLSLAWLYANLEMNVHALQAFRRTLEREGEIPNLEETRAAMARLEERVQETAADLGIPVSQAEGGLRYLEVGNRAIQGGDYAAAISANRQAARMMGDWPPPHNNLSLALFFDGQPREAIAIARQVLERDPANLQALGNAIHFLAWTGQEAEARALWPRLENLPPQDINDRTKMAEAAAILGLDQAVYDLLKPLDGLDPGEFVGSTHWLQVHYFIAVAEANLGKRSARRRFESLQDSLPAVEEFVALLKARRPGPGWAGRFPYHHSVELIPFSRMQELLRLLERRERTPEKRFRRQMARFAERFPQTVLMAEKLIWEEDAPGAGIDLLSAIGTPAAHAVLRRFGLSQAGDDETRMQALIALSEAGAIEPDEGLRFWSRGQWAEMQMRQIMVSDSEPPAFAPDVAQRMVEGAKAFQAGDLKQAELKFRQALERDPGIKEAYNNLAAIYANRGEEDRAKEMAHRAIEIDPLYVFPRCNLALFLLDEDDLEGARAMIRPLADRTKFHPQEMGFYTYIQARIHVKEDEYDLARDVLKISLEAWPDNDMAEDLLSYLDSVGSLRSRWDGFWEPYKKRAAAKRVRMQAQISTPDPDVATALSIYTKDELTGMARVVLPDGGWSALRKAELLARIAQGLSSAWQVRRIVSGLDDTQRAALRRVLDLGGQMPWHDFDAEYDNDLEAGTSWQYRAPETTMGALRRCGLLVEVTVDGELLVAIPVEPRELLPPILAGASP